MSFLKIDFQEAINEANAKGEVSNNIMVNKLKITQSKSDATLAELSTFMKSTFTVQDRVIMSLKERQEALDKKMDKISNQVQTQIQLMTSLLTEFKTRMIGAAAVHPQFQTSDQHCMAVNCLSDVANYFGTQRVPLAGLGDQ